MPLDLSHRKRPAKQEVATPPTCSAIVPGPVTKDAPLAVRQLSPQEASVTQFTDASTVGNALANAAWTQEKRIGILANLAEHSIDAKDCYTAIEMLDKTIAESRNNVGIDLSSVAGVSTPEIWKWAAERGLLSRVAEGDPDAIRIAAASGKLDGIVVPDTDSGRPGPSTAIQVNNYGPLTAEQQSRVAELDSLVQFPIDVIEVKPQQEKQDGNNG